MFRLTSALHGVSGSRGVLYDCVGNTVRQFVMEVLPNVSLPFLDRTDEVREVIQQPRQYDGRFSISCHDGCHTISGGPNVP